MPLYKDFSDDVATVLVWEYDENEVLNPDELLSRKIKIKFWAIILIK
jgi:hypothetical protein